MTNKETGIGTPVLRRKDDRFVRGAGEFSDDIVMPGALTAVVLRAPFPHGEILAIDTTAALAAPGVHAVFDGGGFGERDHRGARGGDECPGGCLAPGRRRTG
ncbi:MAG: hypothetical protein VCE75_05845 [Alphaproteobacteria bacterium]